ncbi:hypothetical protein SRABI83_01923 [Arthrobacter sp. Bi83]|nr:hypothetical protein SRABI83_01923 [Arthrobacter sp. Bi83]
MPAPIAHNPNPQDGQTSEVRRVKTDKENGHHND